MFQNLVNLAKQNYNPVWKLPKEEQNKAMQDIFSQAIMGATTAPTSGANVFGQVIPRGDIALARKMASNEQALIPHSIQDVGNALKILPRHLNIPKTKLAKMDINQILNEFLPLIQAQKEPTRQGIFKLINLLSRR